MDRSRLLSLTPPVAFVVPEPAFPGAGVVLPPLRSIFAYAPLPVLACRDAPVGVDGTASPYC